MPSFDEVIKGLPVAVIDALQVLDLHGFQIYTDVRIEDCVKPDGNRRRSFSNRGRYAVGALLKNLSSRDGQELRAFPDDSFEVQPQVEIQPEPWVEPVVTFVEPEPEPEERQEPEPEQEHKGKRGPGRPSGKKR